MKRLLLASALISSAFAGTAFAEDTGPYITIEGGAVKQERALVEINGTYTYTDRFKTGWEAGGAVGYDFGHFRLEAEGFYDRSALREQSRLVPGGVTTVSSGAGNASGYTSTYAAMGNALIGLGHWGGIKAYIGGGAGYARTRLVEYTPFANQLQDRDDGFAWQGLAGLTVPIGRNVDLGVRYRYFRPHTSHLVSTIGSSDEVNLRSHSLLATLTFNLGGAHAMKSEPEPAAAPPPPPPPPPPPMAPPAAVCNKGPYIVFFDWDKSDITAEASSILDNAITAYGNCASVPIELDGYTDLSGTPRYNLGLSARRNSSVQGYLTAHGIPASEIGTHAYGMANPRVPTAAGVRELQNRRVEITYGPHAGF